MIGVCHSKKGSYGRGTRTIRAFSLAH
ncbi:hypothetical protein SBA6_1350007 [Candidatus Sulfopaludibacter sp. SbA6]|nr:hypothetical protein SBA6_1350007 [Candidatus Sulfopaludibacter sp. SbA6]